MSEKHHLVRVRGRNMAWVGSEIPLMATRRFACRPKSGTDFIVTAVIGLVPEDSDGADTGLVMMARWKVEITTKSSSMGLHKRRHGIPHVHIAEQTYGIRVHANKHPELQGNSLDSSEISSMHASVSNSKSLACYHHDYACVALPS
jgi:hypothetical protein